MIFTFILYLVLVMLVGLVAFVVTRNLSDYVLGGRRLGGAVAALSAGASDMSSWLLMGLPGAVYVSGINQIWVSVGLVLGAYAAWRLLAHRLRVYSEIAKDSLTIPAFLDNRFYDNSGWIRGIAACATLIYFIVYIAAGLYAGGVLLSLTFDLSYIDALWIGTLIIMLYTCIGGFLAVSWTDFFQGNFMLICLCVVPWLSLQHLDGWSAGYQKVLSYHPEYFSLTKDLTFLSILNLLGWGLGYLGMPHILVRFMAVKSVKEIPLARRVCMSWMTLSLIGAVLVGLVGAMHFCHCPLENHETVFMELSRISLSPWMMGVILAAILSSSMCAIDSQMLAASSALTEDIYHALFRKKASQRELVWIGRIVLLIIGGIAFCIARVPKQSIMHLVAFAWAGLGSTFGAVVVLSLYWKRMTKKGVIAGMLVGLMTTLLWKIAGLDHIVYEIIPGTVFSLIGSIGISVMYPKIDQKVVDQHKRFLHSL